MPLASVNKNSDNYDQVQKDFQNIMKTQSSFIIHNRNENICPSSINSKSLSHSRDEPSALYRANMRLGMNKSKVDQKETVANVLRNEKQRLRSIIKNSPNVSMFTRLM